MGSSFLVLLLAGLSLVDKLSNTLVSCSLLPNVSLGYATYQGVTLEAGVDQYLGIKYAEAPIGDLRFRAPQDPKFISGVQSASSVSRHGISRREFDRECKAHN